MKTFCVIFTILFLFGCAEYKTHHKHQLTDRAEAEARRQGNSGPLYDHYVACLDNYWVQALDAGNKDNIYEAGLAECAYELNRLCDYYAVQTCYQDAKMANRLLFSIMLEDYHIQHHSAK